MKKKYLLYLLIISVLIFTSCSKSLYYKTIKTESKCTKKEAYWYQNKCWKDYKDNAIPSSKIDSIVTADIKSIKNSTIKMNNNNYPLISFLPMKEDEGFMFIIIYKTPDKYKTLVIPTKEKNIKNINFKTNALLFDGDALSGNLNKKTKLEGKATVKIVDEKNLIIDINGQINDSLNQTKNFSLTTNKAIIGAGTSKLEIRGDEAYLSGSLGTITYQQIKDLVKQHPDVKTIVLTHITGSVNDAVNMHTGELIRDNGIATKVLSYSDIASGGVDLFCAGNKRIVNNGAKIGVHSWCCFNGITADKLPKNHPAHKEQLAYFKKMLGEIIGPGFYFYTLKSAAFDDIHYMKKNEIIKWNVATEFIDNNN